MQTSASNQSPPVYDIAIIGGGINGCGIARDAAGRGWSVYLCDKGDLASATSSASTKLIHGGLRYLEYYEFRLVREALLERETLWKIAPHIIWPLRFVLPHHSGLRPAWLLRLGLFLYDHMGGRKLLPPTRTLSLRSDPTGAPLHSSFARAFEFSDCWVEDSRLVALNARDAADRGAVIETRHRCVNGVRTGGTWKLVIQNVATGTSREICARTLINAAGPWVGDVLASALGRNAPAKVRLVKGSHIVVKKLYDHDRAYFFQNADGRIFFAIPYEGDFTLIGTTDLDYRGDAGQASASTDEISYLCKAASAYFKTTVTPDSVVWTYSGVRPLYDDGATQAQAATRDYVLKLDAERAEPPLLTVYGGKITTYRKLAEHALSMVSPHLPAAKRVEGWTGQKSLPGGDFAVDAFNALVANTHARYPFLQSTYVRRLVRAYGTRATQVLGAVTNQNDLGRYFGADLYEAEVRYLMRAEFAETADDIVWRRSKLGLRLTQSDIAMLDRFVRDIAHPQHSPLINSSTGGF